MRFFPRTVLLEVRQDGADGGGFLDATIHTAPPQWVQVVTSMEKTRLRRCGEGLMLNMNAEGMVFLTWFTFRPGPS